MNKDLNIFNTKYDCIFSMGSACFSAELLTKAKLRVFSSPFDWLRGGNFKTRGELICNGFEDFLNIEYLEKIGEREYPENCDIYSNKHNGIEFIHDFPKGEKLADSYPKVKNKYDRRIDRLIEKLYNSEHSLIVYMELFDDDINGEDVILPLADKINKKFNKDCIDVLYIKHSQTIKDGEHKIYQASKNVYIAELYNRKRDNDDYGNYKNCKWILSKIKLKKSFNEMFLKVFKGRTRVRIYFLGFKIMSFKVGH